jgi:hypothetical protein
MLGGYCNFSSEPVEKTFTHIPSHKRVKIMATFHFIDSWMAEYGWLQVKYRNEEGKDEWRYVWTE